LPEVEQLAEHEDPLVREQVLGVLGHWQHYAAKPRVLNALKNDIDFGVRAQAGFALVRLSTNASKAADTRALLDRFLDEDEDLDARRSFYEALLVLHGRNDIPSRRRGIDLATDVDWEWVEELQQLFRT
jgi:HEAT repeat protein